jgi:hypothetical protein
MAAIGKPMSRRGETSDFDAASTDHSGVEIRMTRQAPPTRPTTNPTVKLGERPSRTSTLAASNQAERSSKVSAPARGSSLRREGGTLAAAIRTERWTDRVAAGSRWGAAR